MKMKNASTICFVAVVLLLAGSPAPGVVEFKDGLTHDIDYEIADAVRVDEQAPWMYTTVNLLPGGRIRDNLEGWGDSRINVLGGSVDDYLMIHHFSRLNISAGSLGIVTGDGYTQMNISGGSIEHSVNCGGFSQADISGGSILLYIASNDFSQVNLSGGALGGFLDLYGRSRINIFGSDFTVDGQSIRYGELTSILGGDRVDEPLRRLTGILASGEPINNDFRIGNYAKIVLIPEPATIVLLGLGALSLRKHRK
jgi:hypothetical protein